MNARLFPGNRQILTRTSESDNVYRLDIRSIDLCHIAEVLHSRESVARYTDRKLLNLAGPYRLNPEQRPGKRKPTGSIEQTAELHPPTPVLTGDKILNPEAFFLVIITGLTLVFSLMMTSSASTDRMASVMYS